MISVTLSRVCVTFVFRAPLPDNKSYVSLMDMRYRCSSLFDPWNRTESPSFRCGSKMSKKVKKMKKTISFIQKRS